MLIYKWGVLTSLGGGWRVQMGESPFANCQFVCQNNTWNDMLFLDALQPGGRGVAMGLAKPLFLGGVQGEGTATFQALCKRGLGSSPSTVLPDEC